MNNRNCFTLREIIFIVIITGLLCSLGGSLITYNNFKSKNIISVDDNKYIEEFVSSFYTLKENYYGEIDDKKLMDAAIKAMYQEVGDPYTTYLNEDETLELSSRLSGTYNGIGIGINVNDNNQTIITKVYEGTPSEKAGLMANDIILKINDNSVSELAPIDVANLIKNSKDTVKVNILRGEDEKEFNINIESLILPSVSGTVIENGDKRVGYIYIEIFSETTFVQFKNTLQSIEKEKIDSLIIDVRENTGGYLTAATSIAEMFLNKDEVIYSLKDNLNQMFYQDQTEETRNYSVIVLIDGNSASASEILAAALKESYGAVLVGARSYGKGKVQQTSSLNNGSMVKYTMASWYTPNNVCIDGVGITPDYEISIENNQDTQLLKALELLK